MKPINFTEADVVYGKGQEQYRPLPVARFNTGTADEFVVSCWSLNWKERVKLCLTGKLWLSQMTCGHRLQAQLPSASVPFVLNG